MNEQEPVSADAPAGQVGTQEAPASTVTEVTSAAEAQLPAPIAATEAASVAAATPESPASVPAAPSAAPEPTPAAAVSTDVEAKAATSLPLSEEDYGAAPQTFAEMALADDIHQALLAMGFTEPLPVQRRVYRPILAGRDLIVQSRTGSGKTAAFGIPLIQAVIDPAADVKNGHPQALVLGPTRELALQVSTEVSRIAERRALTVVPIYGGAPMGRQMDQLRAGGHFVSGTPGRILDHIRRGTLHLDRIRALVLDEADEMLSMGFLEDIIEIIKRCPLNRQTLLFSATMPDDVVRLASRHQKSPLQIQMSEGSISASEITHAYYMVPGMGRTRDLLRVLEVERPDSAVIFCNTREETSTVAEYMRSQGLDAEAISSDLSQSDRERVMGRMKAKDLKYLVATDVAARGIDISDLSHVFNFTFPESAEVYVHRTGRTGRAGKRGVAISLISPRELGNFYYLKLTYKIRPEERSLPTEADLQTIREGQYFDRLQADLGLHDPAPVFRSLLRRIISSEEGERLIASLLEQHLLQPAKPAADSGHRPSHKSDADSRPKHRGRSHDDRPARDAERAPAPTRVPPKEAEAAPPSESEPRVEGERAPRSSDRPEPRRERGDERGKRRDRRGGDQEERFSKRRREQDERTASSSTPAKAPATATAALPEVSREQATVVSVADPAVVPVTAPVAAPAVAKASTEKAAAAGSAEAGEAAAKDAGGESGRRSRRRGRSGSRPPQEARTAVPGPSDVIHADDGREFWEAWVDSRTSTAAAGTTSAAAAPTAPATIAPPTATSAPEAAPEASGSDDGSKSADGERRSRRRSNSRQAATRPVNEGETRLYLNLGRRDNISEESIGQFVEQQGMTRYPLELHTSHTYLYVPDAQAEPVITALHGKALGERTIQCERARR